MELILELILLFFIVPLIFAAGMRRANVRPKEPKHKHYWGEWAQDNTRIVSQEGKYLYHRGHQERTCLGCGFYEKEWL